MKKRERPEVIELREALASLLEGWKQEQAPGGRYLIGLTFHQWSLFQALAETDQLTYRSEDGEIDTGIGVFPSVIPAENRRSLLFSEAMVGPKEVYQDTIDLQKALKKAVDALHKHGFSSHQELLIIALTQTGGLKTGYSHGALMAKLHPRQYSRLNKSKERPAYGAVC